MSLWNNSSFPCYFPWFKIKSSCFTHLFAVVACLLIMTFKKRIVIKQIAFNNTTNNRYQFISHIVLDHNDSDTNDSINPPKKSTTFYAKWKVKNVLLKIFNKRFRVGNILCSLVNHSCSYMTFNIFLVLTVSSRKRDVLYKNSKIRFA